MLRTLGAGALLLLCGCMDAMDEDLESLDEEEGTLEEEYADTSAAAANATCANWLDDCQHLESNLRGLRSANPCNTLEAFILVVAQEGVIARSCIPYGQVANRCARRRVLRDRLDAIGRRLRKTENAMLARSCTLGDVVGDYADRVFAASP